MAGAPFPLAGEAAALGSSVTWAGAVLVFRRMRGRVEPAAVGLVKNVTAALAFTVLGLFVWRTAWPVSMSGGAQTLFVISGVSGLAICDTFLIRSLMEIGPRRATLLMLLAPVWVFVAALFPPLSETSTLTNAVKVVGVVLAFTGVALAARESPDVDADPARWRRGVIDGLVASAFQAAGIVLSRAGFGVEKSALRLAASDALPIPVVLQASQIRLVAGAAGIAIVGAALGLLPRWARSLSAKKTLAPIAGTALFGTFLGIGLFQAGQAWAASSGVATTLSQLTPVWLIVLTAAFARERHRPLAWISTVIAFAGVALMTL